MLLASPRPCERCGFLVHLDQPHERAYGGVLHVGCCRLFDLAGRGEGPENSKAR